MSAETLLTAARRIVRFVRIDDHREGGLLSLDTIKASETLAMQVEIEEKAWTRESIITEMTVKDGAYYALFDTSTEAVEMGKADPGFRSGDKVVITVKRSNV